ncbi:MAG: glutamate carboxypeptidase [Arenicella sp.]|jgi:glutamate carboxypeptidase
MSFPSISRFRKPIISLVCIMLVGPTFASQAASNDLKPKILSLTQQEEAMIDWIAARQAPILEELSTHVNINTGTANIKGLDYYRGLLKQELLDLGFTIEQHSSPAIPVLDCDGGQHVIADHLLATRKGKSKNRILLNGHMDTVFSNDDEFQTLIIERDGRLKGPGVVDMKGGIVVMLNALRALKAANLLEPATMTILLNSDEEIGSIGSRPLIEKIAKQHDIGIVFEGSFENRFARARKGLGQARLKITGRESHAGGSHEDGVSASLELAHKIIEIENLTDYQRKTTVNVGVMQGGEKRNTIPGCADAYIDMRFPTQADGEQLKQKILGIAANTSTSNPRYPDLPSVESWAILHRPAKAQNPVVDDMISEAMGLSKLIGEPIIGSTYSGGGTDGSLAQAVGLATIDNMGLDGAGFHSSREESSVQSLMARTKLAAVMLARQIAKHD